jgi:hypothetical protein
LQLGSINIVVGWTDLIDEWMKVGMSSIVSEQDTFTQHSLFYLSSLSLFLLTKPTQHLSPKRMSRAAAAAAVYIGVSGGGKKGDQSRFSLAHL